MPEGHPEEYLKGRRKRGKPSKAKAMEMMEHGEVRGKPLTDKQRGYFGAVAGGRSKRRKRR